MLTINRWACLLPPVKETKTEHLPVKASTAMPDAARVLVALRRADLIITRNVYRMAAHGAKPEEMAVEGIGPVIGETIRVNVRISEVLKPQHNLVIHRGPFLLKEPAPRFWLDQKSADFEACWAAAIGLRHIAAAQRCQGASTQSKTPFQMQMDLYRESAQVFSGWTATRIKQLAALLCLTTDELATMVGAPAGSFSQFLKSERREWLSDAVILWLFHLEQAAHHARFGKTPVSIFPAGITDHGRPQGS